MAKVQRALSCILTLLILTVCMGGQAWADLSIDWNKQYARMNAATIGAATAGAACTTMKDEVEDPLTGDYVQVGRDELYNAAVFTSGSAYTLCRVDVLFQRVDYTGRTLTLYIYDNDSGEPGSAIATADATMSSTSVSTDKTWTTFNFASGVSISNATAYWIVVKADPDDGAWNSHIKWLYGAWVSTNNSKKSDDASTWADAAANHGGCLRTYSQ